MGAGATAGARVVGGRGFAGTVGAGASAQETRAHTTRHRTTARHNCWALGQASPAPRPFTRTGIPILIRGIGSLTDRSGHQPLARRRDTRDESSRPTQKRNTAQEANLHPANGTPRAQRIGPPPRGQPVVPGAPGGSCCHLSSRKKEKDGQFPIADGRWRPIWSWREPGGPWLPEPAPTVARQRS